MIFFVRIIGAIWYGPVFGDRWLKVIGADKLDLTKRKEMQKKASLLYLIQFVLILFQVLILAYFIQGLSGFNPVCVALAIYLAFVVPILASVSMWNNDSKEVAWARFLIQAGYQLVIFIIFGLIIGWWR